MIAAPNLELPSLDAEDQDRPHAALMYGAAGLPIFPSEGKDPIVKGGFHAATTDAAQIRKWWTWRPTANIGMALPTGWWALDVDPRHGGDQELRRLEREHGEPLPFLTLRQITGSGGEHIIFRIREGETIRQGAGESSGFPPGLDTRVAGKGYLIVAPSIHPETGERYRWRVTVEPVFAPAWLVELVKAPPAVERAPYVPPVHVDVRHLTKRQRYAAAVLRGEAKRVAEAGDGFRNDTLNKAWWRVLQFRDVVSESESRAELMRAALACGLDEREIERVLR